MLRLVLCELLSVDAAVAIQVEVAEGRHLHAFAVLMARVHTLAAAMLFAHCFVVCLLPGRQFGLVQHAIAIAVEITERGSGRGAFHRLAGFSHGGHSRATERIEFFLTDKSIAIGVKLREGRGAVALG